METHIHNLIILDESGSMQSIKQATVSGYNELVQTIQGTEKVNADQKQFVTFITFNGLGVKTHLFCQPASALTPLTNDTYLPDASTPLYDAIGKGVNRLRAEVAKQPGAKVLVTILTDGEENASQEYDGKAIKALVEELKTVGWTFTYIGANHDVEKAAMTISIKNTLVFSANDADMKAMWEKEKRVRTKFYSKTVDYFSDTVVDGDYFKEDDAK